MTAADWTAQNPVLPQFQIGIEVNAATGAYGRMKIGDGQTAWNDLNYLDAGGVKVYRALLTQTGTDAPVATVLENTLGGDVVWTRNSAGRYVATLAGAFTDNKTVMPGGTTTDSDGFLSGFTSTSWIDADSMKLCTQVIVDLISRADDLLLETPITIEVYP